MENSTIENASPSREPPSKEEIVKQVIELQKNWPEYVAKQTPQFILELYEKNLLRLEINNEGKIMAVLYVQPLDKSISIDNPNQIFRIGGLASSPSTSGTKALIKIVRQLEKEALEKKWNIIGRTDNPIIAKYLKKLGMEELTFEECKRKYEKFLNLYLETSSKEDKNQYLNKTFYIHQATF
ncbi:hypothetical protein KKG24_00920 [Patescibacteria group bacterium]|nr:hypothetical protein [Patescibacteria group bacterium]